MSASTLSPAEAFARLQQIVAQLRAPDGCPWDREQTHLTLRRHLIEESYETIEAIERGDDENLCEELGDLLMQPVLHAQIAAEENRFDIVDVLEAISDKLVRRHPHVFGDTQVENSQQVLTNWEAIKRQEKIERGADLQAPDSVLANVPAALPALSRALEISKKAARVGFEWPDATAVFAKLHEEFAELEAELNAAAETAAQAQQQRERIAEELGDLLFTAVNVARWQKIDPELALRDMLQRFTSRFTMIERAAAAQDLALEALSPQQWDILWNTAKEEIESARNDL